MSQHIYDNTNIAESYAGVTTPLTLSFVRYVYEEVYQHFCTLMGVSTSTLRQHRDIFTRMVVPIGYRLYYDLRSWYTMISWLPGYAVNQEFFDRMLGVPTSQAGHTLTPGAQRHRSIEWLRITWHMMRMVGTLVAMPQLVRKFNQAFDRRNDIEQGVDLTTLTWTELDRFYHRNTDAFLAMWRVPIGNDLAVMISTGLLRRVAERWGAGVDVANHLSVGANAKLVALDPGRSLSELTSAIVSSPAIATLFRGGASTEHIYAILRDEYADSEVWRMFNGYVRRFGQRIPNELKLETKTFSEDPTFLIRILVGRLQSGGHVTTRGTGVASPDTVRPFRGWKRWVWSALLRWSRSTISLREETRFRRTQIFGLVRKLYLEVGRRLVRDGIVHDARDVFWMTMEEIWQPSPRPADVMSAITARRAAQRAWDERPLPKRIESDLEPDQLERQLIDHQATAPTATTGLSGLVVSRLHEQSVRGDALVMPDFDPSRDCFGKILVTRQTDPGWTVIFPLLKGLIVERGGMLSHAAIVARELGIPCIVGASKATNVILNGSAITMDMQTGSIDHG